MHIWKFAERNRTRRNRAKAQALIDQYGDTALDFAQTKAVASAWQIRDQAHWQRIEKHVQQLLRR